MMYLSRSLLPPVGKAIKDIKKKKILFAFENNFLIFISMRDTKKGSFKTKCSFEKIKRKCSRYDVVDLKVVQMQDGTPLACSK